MQWNSVQNMHGEIFQHHRKFPFVWIPTEPNHQTHTHTHTHTHKHTKFNNNTFLQF